MGVLERVRDAVTVEDALMETEADFELVNVCEADVLLLPDCVVDIEEDIDAVPQKGEELARQLGLNSTDRLQPVSYH